MKLSKESATVWYLNHSGFAVKTKEHFLIFDYYPDNNEKFTGGIDEGLLSPSSLEGEKVIVFSSHGHHDHHNNRILEWEKTIEDINFVLSDDIPSHGTVSEHIYFVKSNQEYRINDIKIKTLKSTDEGVAFLIEVDDICIYHGGDLNWWHWNGETEEYNSTMAKDYCGQVDQLKDVHIDIAFAAVDPRLEDKYDLGIDYLCRQTIPDYIFPMHVWGDYSIIKRLKENPRTTEYRDNICVISRRGEEFVICNNRNNLF